MRWAFAQSILLGAALSRGWRGGHPLSPTVWLAFGGPWFLPLRATRFSGGSITCILPDQCLHLDTSSGKTSRLTPAVSSLLSWAHFVRGL